MGIINETNLKKKVFNSHRTNGCHFTNMARTSAKTHLFEQSLLSGRVQHKLVKAGVG